MSEQPPAGGTDDRRPGPAAEPGAGAAGPPGEPGAGAPGRGRRRTRTTRSRRRRRWRGAGLGLGVVVLALVAAGGWLLYSGLRARAELNLVRAQVHTLRAQITEGDLGGARATARSLAGHARDAHSLTTGPVWALAAAVPDLGRPARTVRVVTAGVASIAQHSLPLLIDASREIDPTALRRPDGSIDLAAIERVAPALDRASATLRTALRRVQQTDAASWLHTVDAGRAQLLAQLQPLSKIIANADTAAHVAPAMLGADGPRSYLVSFQNEAELRGTGGLPGAFAIVTADRGRLGFSRFESDTYLLHVTSGLDFGADYDNLFDIRDAKPYTSYLDSNVSPNFPYAARIWMALWKARTGQSLDGAMTIDPTALGYLLAVTGPAALPGHGQVGATNVVALTEQVAYDRFADDNAARKKFLLGIAQAVSKRLLAGGVDTTGLVRAAGHAAAEHRLLVYSAQPAVEARLAPLAISGVVPRTAAPYVGLAIINAGPNKLDYYQHVSLDWRRRGCGPLREVTVTITMTNRAPATVPKYAQTPTRTHWVGEPTTNVSSVLYYATAGSRFTSVTLDGRPAAATSNTEHGHPVFGMTVRTPRNRPQTIVYHLLEPAGSGAPVTRMQPMVDPVRLHLDDAACAASRS